jgi:putative addiction module component (TIGR02574 family)
MATLPSEIDDDYGRQSVCFWRFGRVVCWDCDSRHRRTVMIVTLEQFGIDRLSPEERCQLMELIWDSLPAEAPFTPPEWHLRELERRLAAADADPSAAEPWETVLARLSRNS